MRNLNLTNRFFFCLGGIAAIFSAGFFYEPLITAGWITVMIFLALMIADIILLRLIKNPIEADRICAKSFSLSEPNRVTITIKNLHGIPLWIEVIDELPVQLQRRDLIFRLKADPGQTKKIDYDIRPVQRGEYHFGNLIVFLSSVMRLTDRRVIFPFQLMVPVYPSILQMQRFELRTMDRIARMQGVKKLRKIGHSYEFETIKNYVKGDDHRAINWKATGRLNQLMVNLFQDEKSQNVYSVIDKSRSMKLPFNNLSLMDYAINTSLVISYTAIQRYDRAGLITFADTIGSIVKADNKSGQMHRIIETLYSQEERNAEASFEVLFQAVNAIIRVRSLIFLYTNFESIYSAQRALDLLRRINSRHLLVVVFFENTEMEEYSRNAAVNIREIYSTTIARKFVAEKHQIAAMLSSHRIQVITTSPEDLTINSINKYLELKSRGLI